MELEAMEAAAVYRKLAGQFSGRGREQLRHLHDMQMEILACLRGIGRLSGSGGRKTAQIAVPEEPAAKALEKRYHCARRAVTEYTVRTVDGDFGIVFQHLADLSREECVLLARLLGEQAQNISRHREETNRDMTTARQSCSGFFNPECSRSLSGCRYARPA